MKKILFSTILLLSSLLQLKAQQLNYPLATTIANKLDAEAAENQVKLHSSFKPIRESDWKGQQEKIDSVIYHKNRFPGLQQSAFWKSFFTHDVLRIDSPSFHIAVNPLLNLDAGKDRVTDSSFTVNTRGIEIKGSLGKDFSFYTNIFENQAFYPNYIDHYTRQQGVVPGQGMWKLVKKGADTTAGFDFSSSSGYVSYTPFSVLNIQLGNTKNFIGNGYRSLFLSDNAYNYPSLKFTLDYKDFRYVWMLAEFQDFMGKYYDYHYKKHASFMYLNWSPKWWLELGLFESAIWKTSSDNYTKRMPFGFFNPVILTHALQYGLGGEENILLGANFRINPDRFSQVYGQFIINDLDSSKLSKTGSFHNKIGYQIGAKIFDIFRSKLENIQLFVQLEYNHVNPYTYGSAFRNQSYSNLNQPLAHPLGAGFNEIVLISNLRLFDFFVEAKLMKSTQVYDQNGRNYGASIFSSDSTTVGGMKSIGHTISNGPTSQTTNFNLTFGYNINYRYLLQFYVKLDRRNYEIPGLTQKLDFISFGLRTNINNYYFDF